MTRRIGSVALPNGTTLTYVEQGAPSGVPLILLHGYTDSWRSFEPLLMHLPPSFHVYAPTQRGHGDSDRPAVGYAARDFAGDLKAFMDELGLKRAVIAGHSLGAQVAQRFAIDHPRRVLALVLIGGFATLGDSEVVEELWASVVSRLRDPVDPDFVRAFQESTLAARVPPAFLDTVVAESLKVPARVWRAALEGQRRTDLTGELARIDAPTLILWGGRDEISPRSAQYVLATSIPDADFLLYNGAGHAVHWEQPRRVATDLRTFVESSLMADAFAG